MGAGCKAWDSRVLIQSIKEHSNHTREGVTVIPTKCLNNCGGGVTMKTPLSKKPFKVRNPRQICKNFLDDILGKDLREK